MAPKTVSVTVKYAVPGTQPPIFLAGSFSDPAWEPQEMQFTTDENNEHEFSKEVNVEQGKEYQYKFRIGLGDWWILNENSPTGTDNAGNRNNVLTAPVVDHKTDAAPTEEHREEDFTMTKNQWVHDAPSGTREATPEPVEEAMGTRETSDVLFSDEIVKEDELPTTTGLPMPPHTIEPLEPHPTPAAGLEKNELEFGLGLKDTNAYTKIESAERIKPAAVPSPEISLKETLPTPSEETKPNSEHVETKGKEDTAESLHVPALVVEKVDDEPSYGDDFGPNATTAQKDAHNLRSEDAEPDQTIIRDTHTPELADVAAEVADTAETLDRGAPTPPISDEEAGRIGYRRLSDTPIPEIAKTAAEVADVAAVLDRKALGDLLEERGYFAIIDDESIVFPETPADEKVPLFPHERGCDSPKGSKNGKHGPVDIPRKLQKIDDQAFWDPNDPSFRDGIHGLENPISPGITLQDPSPSLDAITEDEEEKDEEQEIPTNGGNVNGNGSAGHSREPTVQVNGIKDTEKPAQAEKENGVVPTILSQGENAKAEPEVGGFHREIPALAAQNIQPLINHSIGRSSFDGVDDNHSATPSVETPAIEVQSAEPKLTNPNDRPASTDGEQLSEPQIQIPATPLIVGNRQLGHEVEDVQQITTKSGLSIQVQPATPRGSTAESSVGKSSAMEDKNVNGNPETQIKSRKRQPSPTPDRPLTPSSMQGKEQSKNILRAIWRVIFVEWIGGFIMRLCNGGRGRQS
ncbi:uncharacterized protein RCO7_09782 [Rhynchosporium graminicola]|uniref:AMP-activated protein kinase glycogen-binding domain-containing protein n=1 Tax=Rhynchosporium graminicola TaxID=2792576 RepID=A0A1E1LAK5_9HELO|nr:uncharacterized protein RCO7_09782 [Rhynchosporium commune]